MKRLIFLIFVCLLLASSARAAGVFISALPTTNSMRDTNFVLLVIPELGVNDTWLSNVSNLFSRVHTPTSLTAGTNLLRFTNECYTTANQNTNVVVVSGAGTASANGAYTNGGGGFYLKPSTTNGLRFDGIDWLLTNNAGSTLYSLSSDYPTNVAGGWSIVTGAAPAPSSIYGSITNCFTVLVSSAGLALPTLSSNLYVSESGNDTNALRGRLDRPWRNVQAALAAAVPGDAVMVGPGNFQVLAAYGQFYVSNNVRIIGSGMGVTFIGTPGDPDEGMSMGTETVAKGFTFYGLATLGGTGTTSTNALVDACELIGAADSIYISAFERLLTIQNSYLYSRYDGLADWEARPGGSNRLIRILNTHILVTNLNADFPLSGITGGDNRIEMIGGSITVLNGSNANRCINFNVDTFRTNRTGSMYLSNVRLRHASTNTASLMVTNLNRLPIFLENCTLETFLPGLTSGSFTNGWEHRHVAIPNGSARTNRLVDTRSLTNALCVASEQGHRIIITDDGGTASGTNVYIYPSGNQKINQQSFTNIVTDYGSIELMIRGTNWAVVRKLP